MREADARVAFCIQVDRDQGRYLYIWGGESSGEGGADCSGFACMQLEAASRIIPGLYDGKRRTAAGLYGYYEGRGAPDVRDVGDLEPGALVFYRSSRSDRIYHVAIHIATLGSFARSDGSAVPIGPVAIESGGAGSRAKTPRDALLSSAGVRMTASDNHGSGRWVSKDPFKLVGLGV